MYWIQRKWCKRVGGLLGSVAPVLTFEQNECEGKADGGDFCEMK